MENKNKTIYALNSFIQQIYLAEDLTAEQSKRNLEESLVEIVEYCGEFSAGNLIYPKIEHTSNGILITEDGYFLTASHCLNYQSNYPIKFLSPEGFFDLQGICEINKEEDIALAKMKIPKECKPKKYKIFNTNQKFNTAVTVLLKKEGKIERKFGFANELYFKNIVSVPGYGKISTYNHLSIKNLKAIPGDSGGSIISLDGRLMGLLSLSIGFENNCVDYATGIKIIRALELIRSYIEKLKKEI